MDVSTSVSVFSAFSLIMIVVYGLFILLGLYALYLFIKLMIRGIEALDIYLDEKRNRML
jgi:preprotein translocase subunit SecD